jgi:GNAT superfamily N-acetyltransferase
MTHNIIFVRDNSQYLDRAADYFSSKWPVSREIYYDNMLHSINTPSPLPCWYLLMRENDTIIGCFGMITNDFNSRQDLWPWLCALYVEESECGQAFGSKMLAHGVAEAKRLGFQKLYLCTDHIGYYEKYGFSYIGKCCNMSEESRLYGEYRLVM